MARSSKSFVLHSRSWWDARHGIPYSWGRSDGGDPEHKYFADGMVEEIITALSRFKSVR
jgi:hypothetical protein